MGNVLGDKKYKTTMQRQYGFSPIPYDEIRAFSAGSVSEYDGVHNSQTTDGDDADEGEKWDFVDETMNSRYKR